LAGLRSDNAEDVVEEDGDVAGFAFHRFSLARYSGRGLG
jgi:hypothetical protein